MAKENIIISLGGSLVVPETGDIDVKFLKSFQSSLIRHLKDKRFFILVGGGKTARKYQKALLEFGADSNNRDWIGINVTKLNAEIIRQMFADNSYPEIIADPTKKIKTNKEIIIGAGYRPGWSTDYVSVLMAKTYKIKTIINLTNVDYVFDKNPKKFPNAKPFKEISWKDFRQIAGKKWSPGLSLPFDPKASELAEKLKLEVVIINGGKLRNFDNFLNKKSFIGTIIK